MNPLVPSSADDVPALQMENDLLRHEVTHLRARLAGAEAALEESEPTAEAQAPAVDDQAREDLVWLLRRLDDSPAGPIVRRFSGFRSLRDRYLDDE